MPQGITILQAVEQLDAGPVRAWEQFPIDIDERSFTKLSLYRGAITRAAVKAVPVAISRITKAIAETSTSCPNPTALHAMPEYAELSITKIAPLRGGKT